MTGNMGKMLRVDLTERSIREEPTEERVMRSYLGGCGFWAGRFKKCGYDALVITGSSDTPIYLNITNDAAKIKDAADLWGKETFETDSILRDREGRRARPCVIGPAGEHLVNIACIITDGKHGRALGRCGVGAVMGSKMLKAVVANGTKSVPTADPDAIKAINKSMTVQITEGMGGMKDAGTGGGLEASEELGNLPIRNWGQGSWREGAVRTTGMTMTRQRLTKSYSCGSCMISCGRVVEAKGGPYDGQEVAGPEYETLGLMGTNLINDDLDVVIKANELCNRYGLDTISAGGVIGFAHDFEEGATLDDLGSPPLNDRFAPEGKAENVYRMQNLMGLIDSAITCKFPLFGGLTVAPLIAGINAATGWNMDREEFFRTGERIFNIKRLYNNRLGITRKDDTLPLRMLRNVRGGGTTHLPPLEDMLAEYYENRGWDEFGRPTPEKVAELDLEEYAALAAG